MKVKIMHADALRWYKDKIGEIYEVIEKEEVYELLNCELKRTIRKSDCTIIKDLASFSWPPDYGVIEDDPITIAQTKQIELNTFEDCWHKIQPRYYLDSTGSLNNSDASHLEPDMDGHNLPTEKSAKQIQAAIKLFVIQHALNGGEITTENSYGGYSVFFDGALLMVERTNPMNSDTRSPYIFKTSELAYKSIDIGKDIWLTYFGL